MENRDYYIRRLRKKLGYIERAAFRMPASQVRAKRPMHIIWRVSLWCLALAVLLNIAKRLL